MTNQLRSPMIFRVGLCKDNKPRNSSRIVNLVMQSKRRCFSQYSDATQVFYENHAQEYAAGTLAKTMEPWLSSFSAYFSQGAQIADLGCGAGRDLRCFNSRGFRPIGLDLSEPLAKIAHRISDCPIIVGDLRSLPFEQNAFSGVWAAASYLHLPRCDLQPALIEANRILAGGGYIFASVKRGKGEANDKWGRTFTLFEVAELEAALAAAKFRLVSIATSQRMTADEGWGNGEWISCTAVKQ